MQQDEPLVTARLLSATAVSHAVRGGFFSAVGHVLLGKHNALELWGTSETAPGSLILCQPLWGNLLQLSAFILPQDAAQKHSFLVGLGPASMLCHATTQVATLTGCSLQAPGATHGVALLFSTGVLSVAAYSTQLHRCQACRTFVLTCTALHTLTLCRFCKLASLDLGWGAAGVLRASAGCWYIPAGAERMKRMH